MFLSVAENVLITQHGFSFRPRLREIKDVIEKYLTCRLLCRFLCVQREIFLRKSGFCQEIPFLSTGVFLAQLNICRSFFSLRATPSVLFFASFARREHSLVERTTLLSSFSSVPSVPPAITLLPPSLTWSIHAYYVFRSMQRCCLTPFSFQIM